MELKQQPAQSFSKDPLHHYKLVFDILHIRSNEKKNAKLYFLLESLPIFSQLCVFNNLIRPTEMILYLPQ